jgi:hypothetical protein
MVDFPPSVPNLAGANPMFDSFVGKLDGLNSSVLGGLEDDASALAGTLAGDLTSITSDLGEFMPALPALPDINLQSQLTSLAGMSAGSSAYGGLLSSITSNFGDAATAAGSSISSMVSSAASAVAGGDTLSGLVPNMSLPALGGDVKILADAVKQATEDAVKETVSSFTPPSGLSDVQGVLEGLVEEAQGAISSVTKTLADGAKVTKTISNVAQSVERIEA